MSYIIIAFSLGQARNHRANNFRTASGKGSGSKALGVELELALVRLLQATFRPLVSLSLPAASHSLSLQPFSTAMAPKAKKAKTEAVEEPVYEHTKEVSV